MLLIVNDGRVYTENMHSVGAPDAGSVRPETKVPVRGSFPLYVGNPSRCRKCQVSECSGRLRMKPKRCFKFRKSNAAVGIRCNLQEVMHPVA